MQQNAADVILRSSDKELFHSWKIFLSFSSPVFSAMFTLPQPDAPDNVGIDHDHGLDERHGGLPIIDLEEDSCTLGRILSLCHPPSCSEELFKVKNAHELQAVLEAATKYDMESVRRVALKELFNETILSEDAVRVHILACRYECREAARLAARHTLALSPFVREYVPEFEKIHAGELWRLLLYREACAKVACSLTVDHTWISYGDFGSFFGCSDDESGEVSEWTTVRNRASRKYPSGRYERVLVHGWWHEYMKRSGYALRGQPHGNAVKDQKLIDDAMTAISALRCKRCKASPVLEAFRSFVDIFAENIERRVAEVAL